MTSRSTRVSWSDADLARAVAQSRPWTAALRHLNLTPNSRGSKRAVQRRATELGRSIEHFSGRRRWNDATLRHAVEHATDWNDLFEMLGVQSASANSRIAVKAHACRLGLSIGHLDHLGPRSLAPTTVMGETPPQPDQLRRAAPSLAMAWFLLRGWAPSAPLEPVPYDFIAATDDGLKRVQVKTCTRFISHCNGYLVVIAPRRTHGPDRDRMIPYDPDEVDLLFIIDGDGWMYLIELAVVAGKTSLSLNAYQQFRCGNVASLLRPDEATGFAGAA